VHILRQRENGVPVVEVCRQHGSSEQTYYRWKKERPPCRVDLGLPNVSRVEPEAHDRDPKAHRTCSPCPHWWGARGNGTLRSAVCRDYAAAADCSSCGSVTVPGFAIARRVASARYPAGSTPASFADSSRL
jgi:hypothetical protein